MTFEAGMSTQKPKATDRVGSKIVSSQAESRKQFAWDLFESEIVLNLIEGTN